MALSSPLSSVSSSNAAALVQAVQSQGGQAAQELSDAAAKLMKQDPDISQEEADEMAVKQLPPQSPAGQVAVSALGDLEQSQASSGSGSGS